jgi:hypothetical protein
VKLLNFDLSSPNFTIELSSLGLNWDLHNFADFVGLELQPENNSAVMRWIVPDAKNPWGCIDNKFQGCELRFSKLKYIQITERDPKLPLKEDSCLASVSKVDLEKRNPLKFRTRDAWSIDENFCLWFSFQSGRDIEIDSETVELAPLKSHVRSVAR